MADKLCELKISLDIFHRNRQYNKEQEHVDW
jgi:hypothetical protein